MNRTFSARRVPRKIVHDDDEPSPATTPTADASEPTIKRPSVKPRKSSNLRTSFGPTASEGDDDVGGSGVVTPKRLALSHVAIQRNASKRSSLLASPLPTRHADEKEGRPNYSAASLRELKDSTPSTPRDAAAVGTEDDEGLQDMEQATQSLDLSSKFGSSLARYQQSTAIPSATEIAEKKARRARLAKEQEAEEYISLDPDDPGLNDDDDDNDDPNVTRDEHGKLILAPKDKYNMAEGRLVREDEDVMENFDEFTEDGKFHLGRKAEVEAAKERKRDMAAQIAEVERAGLDSDDSDASEKERNAAFEAAQTRHGTYADNNPISSDPHEHLRPKTPPTISALPSLDAVLERLRRQVSNMQASRMQKLREMEALQREKVRLGQEEVRIQKALKETAEKFQQLRAEKEFVQSSAPVVQAPAGLDLAAANSKLDDGNMKDDYNNEETSDSGHDERGIASTHAQNGWEVVGAAPGLGMSRPPDQEDDW